jgi:hypothetical protein
MTWSVHDPPHHQARRHRAAIRALAVLCRALLLPLRVLPLFDVVDVIYGEEGMWRIGACVRAFVCVCVYEEMAA